MARYFFRILNDIEVEDLEGEELDNLALARQKAVAYARDLAAESVRQGEVNLDHAIIIEDASHAAVLKVAFRDAFAIADGSRRREGDASGAA